MSDLISIVLEGDKIIHVSRGDDLAKKEWHTLPEMIPQTSEVLTHVVQKG